MSAPTVRHRLSIPRVTPPITVHGASRHRDPGPQTAAGWAWLAAWVLSRAAMAWLFATQVSFIAYDVRYYFWGVDKVTGLGGHLVEYPVPVVWLLQLLRLISGPMEAVYVYTFVGFIIVLDLALTLLLWHRVAHRAAIYWGTFTFLVGPLLWYRIDLIPAVFVALAIYWLNRRPRAAGAMIALGAATKLWPAMLIVPLLAPIWPSAGGRLARLGSLSPAQPSDSGVRRVWPAGWSRGVGFVLTGGTIALASWVTEGLTRSLSPLTWQSQRGLQIESVVATWPMLVRAFDPALPYDVRLSKYNAWELYGPHVDFLVHLGDRLIYGTALLVLALGWLIVLGGVGLPGHSLRAACSPEHRRVRGHAMVLALLAIILAVLVANKTFSPQYMIWLSGPLAVLGSMQLGHADARHARVLAVAGLIGAGLTQLVFPLTYGGLISGPKADLFPTLLLVSRNLLMVFMTCYAVYLAWRVAWRVGKVQR